MLAGAITFVILVVSLALVYFTSTVLYFKHYWVLYRVVPSANVRVEIIKEDILPSLLALQNEPGFPGETRKNIDDLVKAIMW